MPMFYEQNILANLAKRLTEKVSSKKEERQDEAQPPRKKTPAELMHNRKLRKLRKFKRVDPTKSRKMKMMWQRKRTQLLKGVKTRKKFYGSSQASQSVGQLQKILNRVTQENKFDAQTYNLLQESILNFVYGLISEDIPRACLYEAVVFEVEPLINILEDLADNECTLTEDISAGISQYLEYLNDEYLNESLEDAAASAILESTKIDEKSKGKSKKEQECTCVNCGAELEDMEPGEECPECGAPWDEESEKCKDKGKNKGKKGKKKLPKEEPTEEGTKGKKDEKKMTCVNCGAQMPAGTELKAPCPECGFPWNEKVSKAEKMKKEVHEFAIAPATELFEEWHREIELLTEGLEITDVRIEKRAHGRELVLSINGHEYGYTPLQGSQISFEDLLKKFKKMLTFSAGKALSWLKKNTVLTAGSKQTASGVEKGAETK